MTTDTTTPTLRLVRISDDYTEGPRAWRTASDLPAGDGHVFYAVPSFDGCNPDEWSALIVPTTDSRSEGMWTVDYATRERLGLSNDHRGWNVRNTFLTDVEPESATTAPESDIFTPPADVNSLPLVNSRDLLPGDVFQWNSDRRWWARVDSNDADGNVQAEWMQLAGERFPTGARSFGNVGEVRTIRANAPAAPAPTFTQEDIERARREGRQEAEATFDEWKENATRVAHQYANDNSLCGEFDRCMEAIGLPTRSDLKTEVTVELRIDGVELAMGVRGGWGPEQVRAALREMLDGQSRPDDVNGLWSLAVGNGMVYVRDEDGEEIGSW